MIFTQHPPEAVRALLSVEQFNGMDMGACLR